MTVAPITSADDPRVALFRHIREPELVRSHGLFVAEGRLVVERVLADPRYDVVSVLVNEPALASLRPSLDGRVPDGAVLLCDLSLLEAIAGFDLHRGCLALVRRPQALRWRDARLSSDRSPRRPDAAGARRRLWGPPAA